MITFLIRSIGLWIVAGAIVGVVIDGMKTIASGKLMLTPLGTIWSDLAPASFAAAKAAVPAVVWDSLFRLILALPNWAVLFAVGLALVAIGSRRRRAAFVL